VLVVVFLFRTALAADIGDVVVFAPAALLVLRLRIFLDALDDRSLLGLWPGIGSFEVDDLTQQDPAFVEFVAPDDDGLEGERAFAQARDHRLAAGLDALGDGDFAFARQKLHRTHFAQIHAHGIVGSVCRLFFRWRRGNGRAGPLGEFV